MQHYCSAAARSRATKPARGSALFTEKISRAVVNKLRWKSWEFKANSSFDAANCLQVSRKALPWQLTSNYAAPKDTPRQPTCAARRTTTRGKPGPGCWAAAPFAHRKQKDSLTCRWSQGLRAFRSCFRSFFCHNTDLGRRTQGERKGDMRWDMRESANSLHVSFVSEHRVFRFINLTRSLVLFSS